MKPAHIKDAVEWLQTSPSLEDLREEYPEDWAAVQNDLSAIFERGRLQEVKTYMDGLVGQGSRIQKAILDGGNRKKILDDALKVMVRTRMAQQALNKVFLAAAAGGTKGPTRFNLVNGLIIQMLLFADGLERKPVSMFWFRLIWPFLWQKSLLMPLVQPKGIYCFFSEPLVRQLSRIIGSGPCLEIAAGDGTLSRFLVDKGVKITSTDNYSWEHSIKFPQTVLNCDARDALERYSPETVICSWPPASNTFEKHVFKTRSVQTYIVIGSRHRFASGNWKDYEQQTDFSFEPDESLSRLVLPPELESAVYIFRRKSS